MFSTASWQRLTMARIRVSVWFREQTTIYTELQQVAGQPPRERFSKSLLVGCTSNCIVSRQPKLCPRRSPSRQCNIPVGCSTASRKLGALRALAVCTHSTWAWGHSSPSFVLREKSAPKLRFLDRDSLEPQTSHSTEFPQPHSMSFPTRI